MTQIILFAILVTGSIFGTAVFRKKFEDFLPITCSAIVLIMFFAGTLNILKTGVYLTLSLCCVLWLISAFVVIKEKKVVDFLKNFLTPGCLVFTFLYFVLGTLSRDMVATNWDEFSHWADIVKAMTLLDDLGTNPNAYAVFPSYPPGMALFQYFVQKIYLLVKPEEIFSEWRLFFSYQIFFISFMMPFFKGIVYRNPLKIVLIGLLIWLAPMLFFTNIYSCIYIDPILGFVAGTAFVAIFTEKEKDWLYDIFIYAAVSILILMKDAGMLFAVFIIIGYVIDLLGRDSQTGLRNKLKNFNLLKVTIGCCAILIPKFLWSRELRINQVEVAFSGKVNIKELIGIMLGHDSDNYRSQVLRYFVKAMKNRKIAIGDTSIELSYIIFLLILIGLVCLLYFRYKKTMPVQKITIYLAVIVSVVFVCGMCVSYMYKFSMQEALELAAFERYLRIILHFLWIFVLGVLSRLLAIDERQKLLFSIVILGFSVVCIPWSTVGNNVTRRTVHYARNERASYQEIVDQIENVSDDEHSPLILSLVCLEETYCERLIFGYTLRPHRFEWNYPDDITADEWQKELADDIDYVALYKIDETFIEKFAVVFENPEDIADGCIYKVNNNYFIYQLTQAYATIKGGDYMNDNITNDIYDIFVQIINRLLNESQDKEINTNEKENNSLPKNFHKLPRPTQTETSNSHICKSEQHNN